MLNVNTIVIITQCGRGDGNNKVFLINSLNYIEVKNSWEQQTQTAEVHFSRKTNRFSILADGLNDNEVPIINNLRVTVTNPVTGAAIVPIDLTETPYIINQKIKHMSYPNTGPESSSLLYQSESPLIQRGDIISIFTFYGSNTSTGRQYFNYNYFTQPFPIDDSCVFIGYVTSVNGEYDIKLKCQDWMYYFMQCRIPNKTFYAKDYTIGEMVQEMIEGISNIPSDSTSNTLNGYTRPSNLKIFSDPSGSIIDIIDSTKGNSMRVGDIKCENATIGMVLKTLKDDYDCCPFFYPGFRFPVLNISPFHYDENTFLTSDGKGINSYTGYRQFYFTFQENIIISKLEYRKVEDQPMSAIVKSIWKFKGTQTTATGKTTVANEPLTVFVGDPGGVQQCFLYTRNDYVADGTSDPAIINTIKNDMRHFGEQLLKRNHYSGYYGSFMIFGFPYVYVGDRVYLSDPLYPERNGNYMVKRVNIAAGVNIGIRQEIFLDYKITSSLPLGSGGPNTLTPATIPTQIGSPPYEWRPIRNKVKK